MKRLNNDSNHLEMRYFNLLNSILDMLFELNTDLTITYANNQVYSLLGYSSEEIMGKRFTYFIHPGDTSRITEIIDKAIKKKNTISTELKIKNKKGYYLPISANGRLVEYNSKSKLVILLRDITQIKEAQQKLIESDKKYREIIENIEDGYFEVDLKGNYTYVNNYICRYLGISKKELLGKSYINAVDKETTKDVFQIFNEVYTNNLPKGTFESQVVRSDGEKRTFEGSFYLKLDSSGRKVGFYGFTRDITEKKEAEKNLKQSEQQFREAYNRAELYKDLLYHDINNILNNIGLSIELSEKLLNEPNKENDIKEIYEIIKKQFARGTKLITNVRKLSSLDFSEKSFKTIEVIKMLEDTINVVIGKKSTRDIDISLDSFQDEIFIQANDLLIDIFENLLINALNYSDKSKVKILIKISRELQKKINFIKFEFMDNGIGVSEKKKKIIFQQSFNKEKGSKGMGLGLTLVKKIIESYGGEIWVENRVKEDYTKGANFIFLIPDIE